MTTDPAKRHLNSIIAEWILKIALVFFVFSIFFDTNAREFTAEYGSSSTFIVYLKIAITIVFGIIISALSRAHFKIVGFMAIIIGSMYKILIHLTMDKFMLIDWVDEADNILLIAVSIFYLYRHHRHEKKAKKVKTKKQKHIK